ncbi:apoptosis-associated speck-like protein containing a CARD [Acipenser ruthenus]|uniref:apoptosis-associated speck-like protein containing a CARD n=1 Tax=Acipenser ruthenus TaxID=7906 RepID=UPI002740A5CB|nr:apoptosis-associated speck-like protein containing a CARD [Acipenser ruthenus]
METTAKDHIIETLDDLDDNGLKRFKDKLGETAFQGRKISKGKLQNAGSVDVATLLISTYTKTHAIENTIAVLIAIKEVALAEELQKKTGAGASGGAASGVHFVDQHREALIQRVVAVPSILDSLFGKEMLLPAQYDEMIVEKVPSVQMRKLYMAARAWGKNEKDAFLEILRVQQPHLIRDLEGE